jgi:hypothetical protein
VDSREFDNEVVCRVMYAYVKGNGPEPYSPAVAHLTCLVLDLLKLDRVRGGLGPENDQVRRSFDALLADVRKRVGLAPVKAGG